MLSLYAAVSSVQRQQDIVAACDVVSAILAVEHRAVQPHLADIWQLLWTAAQGDCLSLCMTRTLIETEISCCGTEA